MFTHDAVVTRSVTIDAPPAKVWAALTIPDLMKTWMFPGEIDILTSWEIGAPFVIRGRLHGVAFENKGSVLQFEPENVLQYSHLSSTSRLLDVAESYSTVEFRLAALAAGQTALALTLRNFPSKVIYKHLVYYWTVTLGIIKRRVETTGQAAP
jgi:uncharacterized protein YndB with AHSA1/START domain